MAEIIRFYLQTNATVRYSGINPMGRKNIAYPVTYLGLGNSFAGFVLLWLVSGFRRKNDGEVLDLVSVQ